MTDPFDLTPEPNEPGYDTPAFWRQDGRFAAYERGPDAEGGKVAG